MFDYYFMELLSAKSEKEKERVYRSLEKLGMDRMTAKIIFEEFVKERKKDAERRTV